MIPPYPKGCCETSSSWTPSKKRWCSKEKTFSRPRVCRRQLSSLYLSVPTPTGRQTNLPRTNSLLTVKQGILLKKKAGSLVGENFPLMQLLLAKPDPEREVRSHTGTHDSRLLLEGQSSRQQHHDLHSCTCGRLTGCRTGSACCQGAPPSPAGETSRMFAVITCPVNVGRWIQPKHSSSLNFKNSFKGLNKYPARKADAA